MWSSWLGLAGLTGVLAGVGCAGDEDETCEIPTGEISAVALVVDSGFGIRASIDFEQGNRRGAGAPLRLCDTDVLTIDGQAPTETVKASSVEYSLSLPADADRSVQFSLDRQDQGDQLNFEIDLPPAFEILTPMDDDEVALGGTVVQWEPPLAGGIMRVRLGEPLGGGSCVVTPGAEDPSDSPYKAPGGVQVDDDGEHVLGNVAVGGPSPCEVTLTLARVALGSYPASLTSGGRVEARVERYVDVTGVPGS